MSEQRPFNFLYIRRLFFGMSFILFMILLSEWNYKRVKFVMYIQK